MSQAILILAHKDTEQVLELSECLKPYFKVFIHFDAKHPLSTKEIKCFTDKDIQVFQKYAVNWGAWSICEAMLFLLEKALVNSSINYFHFISGQDYPVIHPKDISMFYEKQDGIFMKYDSAEGIKKTGEPLLWWQKYYFDYDKIQRQSYFGVLYHRLTLLVQTIKHINKFQTLKIKIPIYQGSQWLDLPRYAAEYVLDFLKSNENIKEMLRTGFCSDEFMFQTVLCNSPFKEKIINNNHRFITLMPQHGSVPAILDETNYNEIVSSGAHFARKIDPDISRKLIRIIQKSVDFSQNNQ